MRAESFGQPALTGIQTGERSPVSSASGAILFPDEASFSMAKRARGK